MMDDTGEFLDGSGKLNSIRFKCFSIDNFDIKFPSFERIVEKSMKVLWIIFTVKVTKIAVISILQ